MWRSGKRSVVGSRRSEEWVAMDREKNEDREIHATYEDLRILKLVNILENCAKMRANGSRLQ